MLIVIQRIIYLMLLYHELSLSGLTGSALAWHSQGRLFAPRLLQQVLRFVPRIYTVHCLGLRGTALCTATATGSTPLGYFSSITARG